MLTDGCEENSHSPFNCCRGDLHIALDLYRKAEAYVPDNDKLKERYVGIVTFHRKPPDQSSRILEIEWAIKQGVEFKLEPKKKKGKDKRKAKKGEHDSSARDVTSGEELLETHLGVGALRLPRFPESPERQRTLPFGEATNSPRKSTLR